jgi:DNA-binding IclR family transcriptional regulator
MACVSPDGKPTESGARMLRTLQGGAKSAEDVASETGLPLFRVRGGLRDLAQAGLAEEQGAGFRISPKGLELLASLV